MEVIKRGSLIKGFAERLDYMPVVEPGASKQLIQGAYDEISQFQIKYRELLETSPSEHADMFCDIAQSWGLPIHMTTPEDLLLGLSEDNGEPICLNCFKQGLYFQSDSTWNAKESSFSNLSEGFIACNVCEKTNIEEDGYMV